MSKVVSAKCPECGARLQVDPKAASAKCEYCGAVSPIKTEREVKQAIRQGTQQIHAIQVKNSSAKYIIIFALLPFVGILLTSVISFVVSMGAASNSLSTIGSAMSNINMQWNGHSQPILMDITGDGVLDPIGRVRRLEIGTSRHTEHLAAFNALDGSQIWISDALSDVSQGHHLKVVAAGTTIVTADGMGILKAFNPTGGQLIWSSTVGERVERICGIGQGIARVETTAKLAVRLLVATGQLTPMGAADPKGPCTGVWSTEPESNTPWHTRLGGPFYSGEQLPEINGMDVEYVFRENATQKSIAVGQRESGTRVPMAAAYVPSRTMMGGKPVHHFHRQKVTPQWITNVPAVNPLMVYEDDPEIGAIAMGRAVFPYQLADSNAGWRMACLDVNSGRNLWDVKIPDQPYAAVASNRLIFLSTWKGLYIFDLVNGAQRTAIAARM